MTPKKDLSKEDLLRLLEIIEANTKIDTIKDPSLLMSKRELVNFNKFFIDKIQRIHLLVKD